MSQKTIRADRLLSNLGYGSRKEMAMAVKNGWLEVDGVRLSDPGFDIDMDAVRGGRVVFDSVPVDPPSPLTIMMNKPTGFTCAQKDAGHVVYDLLPERWANRKPNLSTIGRLDKASSGQLLFTDDGDLLHRVIHPKSHTPKHYRVTLRDDLRGDEARLFATGDFMMNGEDKPLKPALWTPEGPRAGVMVLSEGRYHQIRRMFETLENEVVALHRFQTGGLSLGDLAEGTYRFLDAEEIALLFSA